MTDQWNKRDPYVDGLLIAPETFKEVEAITTMCPRAPVVKAIWQDTALHGRMIPEPNRFRLPQDPMTEAMTRPLIDKTVQILAAQPGFYKLGMDDDATG